MSTDPSPPVGALAVDTASLQQSPLLDPAVEAAEREQRAIRVGGALILASALLTGLSFVQAGSAVPTAPLALLIDAAIGITLLRGNAKYKGFAIFRLVAGMLVYGGIAIASADIATLVVQVALSASLLLVLVKVPGKARLRTGVALCVAVLGLEVVGLVAGPVFSGLAGETKPLVDGVARGVDVAYTMRAPSPWEERERTALKADNALADMWLVDTRRDGHVLVVCERVDLGVDPSLALDPALYFDNVVRNLATASGLERRDMRPPADGDAHGRAELEGRVNGMDVTYVVDTRVKGPVGCALYAFGPARVAAQLKPELVAILDSFQLD